MNAAQLKKAYGGWRSGAPVLRHLLRGLLLDLIDDVNAAPGDWTFKGGIRDLFHHLAEPVLARIPTGHRGRVEYALFADELDRMIQHEHRTTYRSLNITDHLWENRRIGERLPHVLVVSEKIGLVRLLRRVNLRLSVSTLAMNGYMNAVTAEYTAVHILQAMTRRGIDQPVHIIALVDYDPAGHDIARIVPQMLARAGMTNTKLDVPLHPRLLTPDALVTARTPLGTPTRHRATRHERFMRDTGGIEGRREAVSLDAFDWHTLEDIIAERVSLV